MIQISPAERRIVKDIIARHLPETDIQAFGSRVHGRAKKWSDLDLVLMTRKQIPPDIMTHIKLDLAESDLPWRVDTLDWSRLDENFRALIEKELTPLD